MKIAIVTQPILENYGGLLQNYALQQVLKKMGHNPKTIDFWPLTNFYNEFPRVFGSWLKTIYLRLFKGIRRNFARFHQPKKRNDIFEDFVVKYIEMTKPVSKYTSDILKKEEFDAVVVGSDQVWRPKLNLCVENMFLSFANDYAIRRIAYAASFGIDEWEFSKTQTRTCSALAQKFHSISVRESSGVELCRNNLGVNATWVLDPTLLLAKKDYEKLCDNIPVSQEKYLAAYVLDMNDTLCATCESIAREKGLALKIFSADRLVTLSIPQWIVMFRDASYVVTDSFHGTVFSILFEKEFKCIYNEFRGSARFKSLLDMHKTGKIDEMRELSLNWLKKSLES